MGDVKDIISPLKDDPTAEIVCAPLTPMTKGIWFGGNPLSQPQTIFFAQMMVINITSQIFYFLLRPLKQPKFVCSVLGGFLLSPFMMGRNQIINIKNFPKQEVILTKIWSSIGLAYFLFLASVKMDLSILKRNVGNATFIGLISVFSSFMVTGALAITLPLSGVHDNILFRGLFGLGLSLTRFPNVVYTFNELNLLTSDLGQLAMSMTMVSELLSWIWMLIMLSHRHSGNSIKAMGASLGFVLFVYVAIRPFVMWIIRTTPEGKPVKQTYVTLILILAMCGAVVADFIGLMHMGVLMIGIIIPHGPPLGSTLIEKAEFFVVEVIMPMFYVSIGYHLDVVSLGCKDLYELTFLVFAGCLAKFGGTIVVALVSKAKYEEAILLGLMMNVKGPYDLLLLILWRLRKSPELSSSSFTVLVLSEVIVTAIVVPIIDTMYNSHIRLKASKTKKNMRSLGATPDNSELRVVCCIHEEENVPGFVALLEATNRNPFSPLHVYILHLIELIGHATPTILPFEEHLGKGKAKRLYSFVQAFDNFLNKDSKDSLVKVSAFDVTAPYKSMHEYISKLALDETVPFILVPFHGTSIHDCNITTATAVRSLNNEVQAHAPCTVGILVDQTLHCNKARPVAFDYHVAVVFIGGADDREALSMGIRMSRHPSVWVTVMRIVFSDHYSGSHGKTESKLDFRMVDEFKLKNAHNIRAVYVETEVNDAEHAFNEIRSLKGKFNLVIVGRLRHVTRSMSDDVMLQWCENPELGIIGDFIAVSDTGTSVLVMQHYGDTELEPHDSPQSYEEHLLKVQA